MPGPPFRILSVEERGSPGMAQYFWVPMLLCKRFGGEGGWVGGREGVRGYGGEERAADETSGFQGCRLEDVSNG